jgi:hypothetical protein
MRLIATAFFAALISASAQAQNCGVPQPVTTIQMIRAPGANADLVPVTINGVPKNFLFDTGGDRTQIERGVAEELHLPVSANGIPLYSVTGTQSREQAQAGQFALGGITLFNALLHLSPNTDLASTADGILAPDLLQAYNVDVDFGSDLLTLFCPGAEKAVDAASVPMVRDGLHIVMPVTLDGHEIMALVDTGSTNTALRMDVAQRVYGLTIGAENTPERGLLNDDESLKTYEHVFGALSFGGVTIQAPNLTIFPDALDRNEPRNERLANRVKANRQPVTAPEMILGMDAMRGLHLVFAFREQRIYLAPAVAKSIRPEDMPGGMLRAAYKRFAADRIRQDDQKIRASGEDAQLFNERCWYNATAKLDLDAALTDCDRALRLKPGLPAFLDSRALVLYQQSKYREALDAYDQILKTDPVFPSSLFMRGLVRGKLGDEAGKEKDLAAAREAQPDIAQQFQPFDLSY